MQPTTKLYAQYTDQNFGNGDVEEVVDLQDAVKIGLDKRSPRFKTFQITSIEIKGEVLKGEPKNHSADIYIGVSQILGVVDVIDAHKAEITRVESDPNLRDAQMTQHFSIQALEGVISNIKSKAPETLFIAERGSRNDFIELKDSEQVFNTRGMRIFPHPTGGLAPEEAPDLLPL